MLARALHPRPSWPVPPARAATASAARPLPAAGHRPACPCGGGCRSCRPPHLGGTTPGDAPAAAPAAPAAAPAAGTAAGWTNTWGPRSYGHDPSGHIAHWGVKFTGLQPNRWLVQRVTNRDYGVAHCDGSAYPSTPETAPASEPRYFEAWWVDGSGAARVPKSLDSPASASNEPSSLGDDVWRFNTRSSAPTYGILSRSASLYQIDTLPAEFSFGAVFSAGELPSTTATLSGLGPRIGPDRAADVQWNHVASTDRPDVFHEIRTTVA